MLLQRLVTRPRSRRDFLIRGIIVLVIRGIELTFRLSYVKTSHFMYPNCALEKRIGLVSSHPTCHRCAGLNPHQVRKGQLPRLPARCFMAAVLAQETEGY